MHAAPPKKLQHAYRAPALRPRRPRTRLLPILLPAWLGLLGGCSSPPAVLELLSAGRAGLADARVAQQEQHQRLLAQRAAELAALDDAFDEDVRRVAAGELHDAEGRPVELSGQWVISARQGYAAAQRALLEDQLRAEQADAVHLDNLAAAEEALDLAAQLVIGQMRVTEPIRLHLLAWKERVSHD